jgi:hypothetical protein
MSLPVNNLSTSPSFAQFSIDLDSDSACKADVLKRFSHSYDSPHDNSCLYWSLIFTTCLPSLSDKAELQEKYISLFGREHIDFFEEFFVLLSSFDGSRVYGNGALQHFLIRHLRTKLVEHMQSHGADYAPYMEDDQSLTSYLSRMLNMHSWGGEAEIRAFSDLFSLPIYVVSSRLAYVRVFGSDLPLTNALCLKHSEAGNHYEFMLEQAVNISASQDHYFRLAELMSDHFVSEGSVKKQPFVLSTESKIIRPIAIKPKVDALKRSHATLSLSHPDISCYFKEPTLDGFFLDSAVSSFAPKASFSKLPENSIEDEELTRAAILESIRFTPPQHQENNLDAVLKDFMMLSSFSDIEEETLKPLRETIALYLTQIIPPKDIIEFSQSEVLLELIMALFELYLQDLGLEVKKDLKAFVLELLNLNDQEFIGIDKPKLKEFIGQFSEEILKSAPEKFIYIIYLIADDMGVSIDFKTIELEGFDKSYEKITQALKMLGDSAKKDEVMSILDLIFNRIHQLARLSKS